jgi:hypothetical protein
MLSAAFVNQPLRFKCFNQGASFFICDINRIIVFARIGIIECRLFYPQQEIVLTIRIRTPQQVKAKYIKRYSHLPFS